MVIILCPIAPVKREFRFFSPRRGYADMFFQKTVDKRRETCFNALKGDDEDGRDAPGHRDPAAAESRTKAHLIRHITSEPGT